MNAAARADTDGASEILSRFESLGGTPEGAGRFVAVQKVAGLSSSSLLSQAELPETTLIRLLETDLEGVGEAHNIMVGPRPGSEQWWGNDPRFPLAIPTGIRLTDQPLAGMTTRLRRRWSFLRDQLRAELAKGTRIFVFCGTDPAHVSALDAALRRYPAVRLLFVVEPGPGLAAGIVIARTPRVLLAALPMRAAGDTWLAVCQRALAIGVHRQPEEAPTQANATAGDATEIRLREDVAQRPSAAAYEALAIFLIERNRIDEAIEARQSAVGLDPYSVPRLIQLGGLQIKAERFADAEASFRAAQARAPDNPAIVSQLATALHRLGDLPNALNAVRRAVLLDPENPHRHLQLANILMASGDPISAEEVIRSAVALAPTSPDAPLALSIFFARLDRLPEALAAARMATQRQPNHARAWGQVGQIAGDLGQYDEADAALTRAVALEPGVPTWAKWLRDVRDRRAKGQTAG